MVIRAAISTDAEQLSRLAIETYKAAFGHSFAPADLEAHLRTHLSVEQFKQYLSEDVVLLAEVRSQMVGYVQFGDKQSLGELELRRLYVRADFQGQGVGSRLMDVALEHPRMKKAEHIVLDVWEQNPRARRLYEHYGFEVIGKQTFVVESGVQTGFDLIMLRRQ